MNKNELETIIGLLTFVVFMVYVWFVKEVLFSDAPILRNVALLAPMVWSCIYVSLAKGWQRNGRPYNGAIHVVAQMLATITAVGFIGVLVLIAIDKIS